MKMPRQSRTLYKKRTWTKVKSLINDVQGHNLDFEEKQNGVFRAFVKKGRTEFFVNLYPPGFGHVVGISETNDADYQEFIDTYQTPIEDNPPSDVEHVIDSKTGIATPVWREPVASDGKKRVLASHKPVIDGKESFNYFTSVGDLVASGIQGGGQAMMVEVTSGTSDATVDIHFMNCCPNLQEVIYVFGGAIGWEDAGWGDTFNFEIHAKASPVVPKVVADTIPLPVDYNLDGDKICYAGPGAGTHALGGMPVFVPAWDTDGHWDLDKVNMVPVPVASGTGHFNWHTTEQKVGNYISELMVYGTNHVPEIIDATEAAPLPYGHWLKLRITNNSNTDWRLWGWLRMYRERLQ